MFDTNPAMPRLPLMVLRGKAVARWMGAALAAAVVATACSGETARFQAQPSSSAAATAASLAPTPQPTVDPSGACTSCWPLNAMLDTSSETVKPIPATAPAPTIAGQLSERLAPPSQIGRASCRERVCLYV